MEKRGAKPEFTDVLCPNKIVNFMEFPKKERSQATAHIKSRTKNQGFKESGIQN
ncbi:hypothetical protein [Methanosarcina sp. 1.H.T.1A.1]|uniref:hypothetical protein n=1 Tax=Methanosarcina sp. 1.H.T.1A.1 TaxID=1483602 RepID=UPI000ABC548D|nr:hypothetical protein [Methanosarcina sp. 1.H.T.1A.1]